MGTNLKQQRINKKQKELTMNKYEVLISESFGVVVEVDAESQEQAQDDAMSYEVLDNAKEVRRTHIESVVVEWEQLKEKEQNNG